MRARKGHHSPLRELAQISTCLDLTGGIVKEMAGEKNYTRDIYVETCSRKASPVEMCTTPNFSTINSHCVPLPEAGAPVPIVFGKIAISRMKNCNKVEISAQFEFE